LADSEKVLIEPHVADSGRTHLNWARQGDETRFIIAS